MGTERAGWFILLCLTSGLHGGLAFSVDSESELRELLLNSSSNIKAVRPHKVTKIFLSFNLVSINTVDIKNEHFSVSGWWTLKWEDFRLNWENTQHKNILYLQMYSSIIWTPALVVDNSVTDLSSISEDTIPLRLRKDGMITWNPPGILKTSCEMDVTYFPFDSQTCTIQATSFGFTIQELNLTVQDSGISLNYFNSNGEWVLLSTWNTWNLFYEDDLSYAKVTFYFWMRRRALYYGLNTLLPVLLNSLLIPLVFLLPHDTGEKIGYCLTCLLAYVVILTIVTEGLPTTAKNQSLLGVYIAVVLLMAGLTVVLTIHSLHIFYRCSDRPIPGWQARLTSTCLRFLRCRQCGAGGGKPPRSVSPAQDKESPRDEATVEPIQLFRRISSIHSSAGGISEGTTDGSRSPEKMSWQQVAQAYDAFFFWIYTVSLIGISIGFFLTIASNQI